MGALIWALYAIAALEVVGALYAVARVGKPRRPLTGSDAATVVVVAALVTVTAVLAAIHL